MIGSTPVVDFRCRPPTPPFLGYFGKERMTVIATRQGANSMPPSFLQESMELFWSEMDEAGIDIGVVVGRNSPEISMGARFPAAFIENEHIAELQATSRGRLVGIGGIDVSGRVHDAVAETVRCIDDLKLKGIFIEPGRVLGSHVDDERIRPVYEACIERGVPIVVMTGPYAGADISATDPVHLDRVAARYPALKLVAGHGCWPYVTALLAVAFKHRNVYVSPDAYMFVPGGEPYQAAINRLLTDQMLFATAYPGRPLLQTVRDCGALPLEAEARRKFMGANALALLGMEDKR